MISLIIPYRNRDVVRVRRCLASLAAQSFTNYEVLLIDSGSEITLAQQVQQLTTEYEFCNYIYLPTQGLVWNKSYAINVGMNACVGDIIIIVDVDLIFESTFLSKIKGLNFEGMYYNYKCYYLPQNYNYTTHNWAIFNTTNFKHSGLSTGLVIATKADFIALNGYDEYYQGWGLEDDDFCMRLSKLNLTQTYLNETEYITAHQYHPESYANVPTTWYIHLLQYMHSTSTIKRNDNGAGVLLTPQHRICLHGDYNTLSKIKITPKEFLAIAGFNEIYTVFYNLAPNTALEINYIQPKALTANTFMYKLKNMLLSKIIKNNIIPNYSSLLGYSYLTTEKLHEFMLNFISQNRNLLADYCIEYVPNTSLIIKLIKK
ncbi:MAG: glycosyltransferase [Bacteroidia bacterium]